MVNRFRLIAVFLSLVCFNSFAAFPVPVLPKYQVLSVGYVLGDFDSFSDIQPFLVSRTLASYPSATGPYSVELNGSLANIGDQSSGKFRYFLNGSSYSANYSFKYVNVSSCPANSTASGSQCSCNAGYEEKNGNSCELPQAPDPCDGLAEFCQSVINREFEWVSKNKPNYNKPTCYSPSVVIVGSGGGERPRFPGCNRGCALSNSGGVGVVEYTSPEGNNVKSYTGSGNALGVSCGVEEAPTQEDSTPVETPLNSGCEKGHFPGKIIVNGIENKVCIPPKSKDNRLDFEITDNGDGTKTQKETSVKCENGVCTIKTEITLHDAQGNETGRTESEKHQTEKEFCYSHPAAAVCDRTTSTNPGEKPGQPDDITGGAGSTGGEGDGDKDGEGEFGGSCESGFTCSGDAIQCSIAKSQHETSCKLLAPAPAEGIPDGTEKDSAQDLQNNATVINVQTDLDYSGLGWNRSCPADEDFDLGFVNGKMTISYSKLCAVLSPMSDIALAITALGLLAWLVAGKKEG